MQKIIIKQVSETGETMQYFRFSSPIMAEMAFHAFTHDPAHQDGNWQLIIDGEMINWHYPTVIEQERRTR
jgi:hypothetical protein